MSELVNWIESRDNLRTENCRIMEMLDSQKVCFEEVKVNKDLSTFLNKAQGYEEKLIKEVKSVVLQDKETYDKGGIVSELKKLIDATKESDEKLLQGVIELLPEKSDSYDKDNVEKKLNEMLGIQCEENQNIYNNLNTWCVKSSDYLKKYEALNQQVSVYCNNVQKYMDWKDNALAVLEESVLCIIEKSDYSKKQMQNKAVEISRKHKARLNWKIALYVVLILSGVVTQVFLFLKSGINEATKDTPVYWARSIWFLVVIIIIFVAQILLIIGLIRTGKKKCLVRNQLEKLMSDIVLRKVSTDEFDRTIDKVLNELK